MSTITFDTHKFVKRLESAGVPQAQAEAMADVQREALAEALDVALATKADVQAVRSDMRELRVEMMGEMKLSRWMIAALIGLAIANFAKQYF
ncbi:MAG: DUF1640 domain-containing protein [Rhodocyclaceae bacterium]|nr:DUF1640 domain-containing protein [Rhodocyclaceae bacterium]